MSQLAQAPQQTFDLAYYECNGWTRQWLQSGVEWDVEIDKPNRRYRVKGRAKLTRSWSGMTQFTVRERVVRVGTTQTSLPDWAMPMNTGQTSFDMSDWVYSEWFAYDDEGKATVTQVPVGFRCCFNHYTRAAAGRGCYDPKYDCYGSTQIAIIDPSGIANGGSPGAAYTDVGQVDITCRATGPWNGTATSTVDYGVGKPGMNNMSISGALSGSTSSTSLTVSSSSLQPNSRNRVTATATNGVSSSSASCEFITPAANSLSNCRSKKSDEIQVDCVIQGGYGIYPPTTVFKYRKTGTSTWQEFFTSKTKTKTTATLPALRRDTYYDIQACTQTVAGTYCGNIVTCKTTPGAYAIIDSSRPYILEYPNNELPQNTRCELCYSWNADCAPVELQVFYRVKNAVDDKWWWTDVYTTDQVSGSHCVTLIDLIPNQTVYECIVRATGCDGVSWDSPVHEFTTPLLKRPYEWNCETLTYMDDLICQALEHIKTGNKTIYANAASKEKCDPLSENPTLTTLWSRFLRWGAGSACLMCDMIDFLIKSGKKNQYFVGEIGWVDILDHIEDSYDEDDDDRHRLVMSDAVRKKIDEKLHEVWHYHGAVDYAVDNLDNVPDNAKTVLNFADDKVYEKVDGNWVVSTKIPQPDDFAVYHFNYENKTQEVGTVKAESAWYYWEGTWNNLDVNIEWMVKVIDEMYSHVDEFAYTEKCTDRMYVKTQDRLKFDCDTDMLDDDERQICFITEPFVTAPVGYHLMTFHTGEDATIIQDQEILDGALAQQPSDPEKYCMDFVEWQDLENLGTPFDWDTIILKDYNLTAIWTPHPVTISFDLGEKAEGSVPAEIHDFCGHAIGTLPDDTNFSRPGGTFMGWSIDGVPIDSSYVLSVDKTANAIWKMQEFNVTFVMNNGDPNVIKVVEYEEIAEPPANPTRTDYIFTGWYSDSGLTNTWDQTAPIYADTTVYAGWIPANYTVTFNTDGGSPVPAQTVAYEDYATKPADPTKAGYILKEWQLNGNPYMFDIPVTENITLLAIWQKVWTVTFDSNGGTPSFDPEMVLDGELANLPGEVTRANATFAGWYNGNNAFDITTTPVHSDLNLKARWTFEIVFDTDGGAPVPDTQNVLDGNAITKPTDPAKSGYEFKGWSADGTNIWNFTTKPTEDMTLTALWEEIPDDVTVTFAFETEPCNNDIGGVYLLPDSQTIAKGSKATEPENPIRFQAAHNGNIVNESTCCFCSGSLADGKPHAFTNWATSDGTVWDFNTMTVNSDITLYAKFNPTGSGWCAPETM